jgi:PAS domain S-box-containing protein
MNKKTNLNQLRQKAEKVLEEEVKDLQEIAVDDLKHLIHELRTYQIELEMQNDELYKAQQRLEESRHKYLQLFEFAPIGYFILNKKGVILEVNLTGTQLLGMEGEYLLKTGFSRYVATDYQDVYYFHLKKLLETEKPQTCELQVVRKDGAQLYVQLGSTIVKDINGNLRQIQITITDIDIRKQAEAKIQLYQEQLRSLVSELSLTEARERRSIADELHGSIVQDLSICNVLLGRLGEALSSNRFSKEVDQIRTLVKQVIHQTRSLTFQLSPSILSQMSFGASVEWLLEQIREQHDIQFHFEEDEQLAPMTEELRIILFKAVRELLVNVVKHAEARNVKTTIRQAGGDIYIDVEDDGVGFDTDKIEPNLGTQSGFGIFNIREQLSFLGGQLEIKSEPGCGTRITIVAPLKREN